MVCSHLLGREQCCELRLVVFLIIAVNCFCWCFVGVLAAVMPPIVLNKAGSILSKAASICRLVLGARFKSTSILSISSWASSLGAVCCELAINAVSLIWVAAVNLKPCSVIARKIRVASLSSRRVSSNVCSRLRVVWSRFAAVLVSIGLLF